MKKPSIVIALGGNAISKPGLRGTINEQIYSAHESMEHVATIISEGYDRVIITHGNGPQVGAAILRSEIASASVYPLPMDMCVADTQGGMGYMIGQVLKNCLMRRDVSTEVVTIVCQVQVDNHHSAFDNPTKPVGKFYSETEARELMAGKAWVMKEDAGRGWRRVVASPPPMRVIEANAISQTFNAGNVVITGGGGGIPVAKNRHGNLYGVEAVVDKDLTSALIAVEVEAEILLIMTGVQFAYLDFGGPKQSALQKISVSEIEKHLNDGEFADGSMKPKIEACIQFLKNGGKEAIITSIPFALEALRGKTGTRIFAN